MTDLHPITLADYLEQTLPIAELVASPPNADAPTFGPDVELVRDQRALRIRRVDGLVDRAEDNGRDLHASEQREFERLREEVETLDGILARAERPARVARAERDDANRARDAHHAALAGLPDPYGGVRVQRRALALNLPDELVVDVRRAVHEHERIRRSVADYRALVPSATAATGSERGRLVNYTTIRQATGPTSTFLKVNAITPAAPVAEGGPKPKIADGTLTPVTIQKLAGYVEFTMEEIVYGVDVRQGIEDVALAQLVAGENAAVVAALAGATAVVAGATPAQSILGGIASVAGAGGIATVVAVAPADLVAILGEQSAGAGYPITGNATELAATLWGVPVVPSVAVAAGGAYVWDQTAVGTSVAMGPTMVVDPYSGGINNLVRIVVEELAGIVLVSPAKAAKVDLVAP